MDNNAEHNGEQLLLFDGFADEDCKKDSGIELSLAFEPSEDEPVCSADDTSHQASALPTDSSSTDNADVETVVKDKQTRKKFKGRPMKRKKETPPKGMPSYLSVLNPATAEQLGKQIFHEVVLKRRFLEASLTARDLAKQLNTNTRYFSITMNKRFHCNFSTYINKLRVEEAMTRMGDSRYDEVSLQDIASMVGFSSRQSFITAFQKEKDLCPIVKIETEVFFFAHISFQ